MICDAKNALLPQNHAIVASFVCYNSRKNCTTSNVLSEKIHILYSDFSLKQNTHRLRLLKTYLHGHLPKRLLIPAHGVIVPPLLHFSHLQLFNGFNLLSNSVKLVSSGANLGPVPLYLVVQIKVHYLLHLDQIRLGLTKLPVGQLLDQLARLFKEGLNTTINVFSRMLVGLGVYRYGVAEHSECVADRRINVVA